MKRLEWLLGLLSGHQRYAVSAAVWAVFTWVFLSIWNEQPEKTRLGLGSRSILVQVGPDCGGIGSRFGFPLGPWRAICGSIIRYRGIFPGWRLSLKERTRMLANKHWNWLVVWLPFFIFPYIGNNHPNWLSYFSEGLKPPTRKWSPVTKAQPTTIPTISPIGDHAMQPCHMKKCTNFFGGVLKWCYPILIDIFIDGLFHGRSHKNLVGGLEHFFFSHILGF